MTDPLENVAIEAIKNCTCEELFIKIIIHWSCTLKDKTQTYKRML